RALPTRRSSDLFADPTVLRVGNSYYAYSTNSGDRHIPVLYGGGMFDAQHITDALPRLPQWSAPGTVWAPAVLATGDGYVLYYVTKERATAKLCISAALAAQPRGPFVDPSTAPMVCDALDPKPFIDRDGRAYLTWAGTGAIHSARLGPDRVSLVGSSVELIEADRDWENTVV